MRADLLPCEPIARSRPRRVRSSIELGSSALVALRGDSRGDAGVVGQRAVSSQAFAFPSINNQSSDLRPASFLSCERVVCKILSFWARDRRALEKEFYNKAPSHNTNQVQSETDFSSSRDERRGVSPRFQADQDSSPQAVAPVIAEHSVFDQITGPQYIGWFIADVTWIYPAHVTWIAIHRPIDCVRAAGLAVAAPPFIAVAPVATDRVIVVWDGRTGSSCERSVQ